MEKADAGVALIQAFAESAAAGDIEALIRALDPAVREAGDDDALRIYLAATVVPYFRDFGRLDTYETIARASFPDGRIGIVHYTYIENQAGEKKPISIALVDGGERVAVVNITVGECVTSRHPRSEGRCP